MKSVFKIIPYLLSKAKEGTPGGVTPLKLQKLLYYAQAWSLVFRNKPLFFEEIQAWVHGPAIPEVYREFKVYRCNTIHAPGSEPNCQTTADEQEIVNLVWEAYGRMSAKYLENLTHSEYPWTKARAGLSSNQLSNRSISLQDMKNYYKSFAEFNHQPRISSKAFLKRKNVDSVKGSSLRRNLTSGMGSVLNLMPQSSQYLRFSPIDFSSPLSDAESLESDWEKVGSYFQVTMDTLKKAENKNERSAF
ncbi:MAG: SocA family protein [Chloroflexaceae bacterium]|nr:SocA family protein [Chloroflexaceae bacterium]